MKKTLKLFRCIDGYRYCRDSHEPIPDRYIEEGAVFAAESLVDLPGNFSGEFDKHWSEPALVSVEAHECEAEVYRNLWNDTGPRFIIDADKPKCKICKADVVATWKKL